MYIEGSTIVIVVIIVIIVAVKYHKERKEEEGDNLPKEAYPIYSTLFREYLSPMRKDPEVKELLKKARKFIKAELDEYQKLSQKERLTQYDQYYFNYLSCLFNEKNYYPRRAWSIMVIIYLMYRSALVGGSQTEELLSIICETELRKIVIDYKTIPDRYPEGFFNYFKDTIGEKSHILSQLLREYDENNASEKTKTLP